MTASAENGSQDLSGSFFQLPDGWGNTEDDDGPSLLDYRTRIAKIQAMHCNETCADCSASNPQWASLLLVKGEVEGLGGVVCEECALHQHYELGEKRCFIKYLQYFHEWTHPELDILEHCGNDLLNEVYEARLIPESEERDASSDKHAKFIRNKYKKCKYRDEEALEEALGLVTVRANLAKHSSRMSLRRNSSRPASVNLSKQSSCSSFLSLNSELTGSSCCLFDLEDDQADLDGEKNDDGEESCIHSLVDGTQSLPSVMNPADERNLLSEVASVDRQRPPRRVSNFVRKGRPSCIIQGIPHIEMEESLGTGETDELTCVTKSSSHVGASGSLSPCPPTRLNLTTQAA